MTTFETERNAIADLVKAKSCKIANSVESAATYDDLLSLLYENANVFNCDGDYLKTILAIVTDAELISRGVYLNKTLTGGISNAKWVVGTAIDIITMNSSSGELPFLSVVADSVVTDILVSGTSTKLAGINIGSGSVVNKVTVQDGGCISTVQVKKCNTAFGTLEEITTGSCIDFLNVDVGAIFNGYTCEIITPL